jgi:glycerol-3-phosphate dehydrogenase
LPFPERKKRMHMESTIECDLLVIGGGLSGAAIARDAAGRGLSVTLCEQDDLASGASSLASGLIRNLAPGEGPLHGAALRTAFSERDTLLHCAPHISKCVRIVMPQTEDEHSGWKMRAAMRLQKLLAGRRTLPPVREVDLLHHVAGGALRPEYSHGWMEVDGWVNVSRLTVLAALDAAEAGARILTRSGCRALQRTSEGWEATLRTERGLSNVVKTRAVVNATGVSVNDFLHATLGKRLPAKTTRMTQILSRRHTGHDFGYLLRAPDGRQVHVLPQEQGFVLISILGSDDRTADTELAVMSETVNRYFTAPVTDEDIIWSRSTVLLSPEEMPGKHRTPLDYALEMDTEEPPLLSVIGGSVGTHRLLAEDAVSRIASRIGCHGGAWTADVCLPGGDLYGATPSNRSISEFSHYVQSAKQRYPWTSTALIDRYVRTYGSRMHRLLENCSRPADLGVEILPGLHEVELRYLMENEWAQTAADILRRCVRLGTVLPADAETRLSAWIAEATARQYAAAV